LSLQILLAVALLLTENWPCSATYKASSSCLKLPNNQWPWNIE
jgi:hypothetical protein